MVVALPTKRLPTLYVRIGEIVPIGALVFTALALLPAVRAQSGDFSDSVPTEHAYG